VHKAPSPDFEVPYVLAVVELDEGWSMLANLLDEVPIGGAVEVTWIDRGKRRLPAFRVVTS
jgi:uncharacterized OB-fold protein